MRTGIFQVHKILIPIAALLITTTAYSDDEKTNKPEVKKAAPKKLTKEERLAEKRLKGIWKTQSPVDGFEPVELFEAMDGGDIDVLVRARDAANLNFIVTNKSDKPLAIQLPPAFAAVPALAQLGGGGFGGGGRGGGGFGGGGGGRGGGGFGGGGGGQGTGGGFGGGRGGGGFGGGGGGRGGGGFGGGGGGGGVFNIPPGKTGKVALATFCLEHGKPDPASRMKYVIKPISVLSSDPKVLELCHMLANDEISQPVAQAAGWNIANNLSWEYMLHKNRVERSNGYFERYFTPGQLEVAYGVVDVVARRAELRSETVKESGKSKRPETTERLPAGS